VLLGCLGAQTDVPGQGTELIIPGTVPGWQKDPRLAWRCPVTWHPVTCVFVAKRCAAAALHAAVPVVGVEVP